MSAQLAQAEIRYVVATPLGRRGRYTMTPVQQRCYRFIVRFWDENDFSPSLEEIAVAMGWGPKRRGRAATKVRELEERGWLERPHHPLSGVAKDRSIKLLEPVLRNLKPVKETTHGQGIFLKRFSKTTSLQSKKR